MDFYKAIKRGGGGLKKGWEYKQPLCDNLKSCYSRQIYLVRNSISSTKLSGMIVSLWLRNTLDETVF